MTDLVPFQQLASVPHQDYTLIREWLRSKRSQHTQRAYVRHIGAFYVFVNNKPLASVTLTDLQDYADELKRLHADQPATQAQTLAAIKSVLTFGQKTGYLQYNVGAALQLPQGKDKLAERILEPAQLHRMIYESERSGNTRNHLMLLLLYGSGIRCSELCALQWKDVQANRETGQITVLGKRNKTRSIPLHVKIWTVLQTYKPEDAKPEDYVFQSRQTTNGVRYLTQARVWQIISGIAKSAGIAGVSPHWLRHTHATDALQRKASIKLVQETLGHTTLAVTGRYTHVRPEESSSTYLDL